MGTCFSSEYDEQHSFQTKPGEIQPSPTKGALKIPPKQSILESSTSKSPSSVVVITKDVKDLRQNPGYSNLDIFTYDEMQMATKLFRPDQVHGEGSFGVVYKGVIDENVRPGYANTQVAIKELDPEGIQGDREWLIKMMIVKVVARTVGLHRLILLNFYPFLQKYVQSGSPMDCNFHGIVSPPLSLDGQVNGHNQQLWQLDGLPPQPLWRGEEVHPNFITPENSLLSYDSSGNSASLHTNELKMEL